MQFPALNVSEAKIARRYAMLLGGPWILQAVSVICIRFIASSRVGAVTTSLQARGSKKGVIVVPVST